MRDDRVERGDWQTPEKFALRCCRIIQNYMSFEPHFVLEPCCGTGNFIRASRKIFPSTPVLGMEINSEYVLSSQKRFANDDKVTIRHGDCLHDNNWIEPLVADSTLVLGNPPWVTNSTLSVINSTNIPNKINFKGLRGIDALTGASNFDISEWIILHYLKKIYKSKSMLAMLCKTSVARNVCKEISKWNIVCNCLLVSFDSKDVFDVSVSACLFICDLRAEKIAIQECDIDDINNRTELLYLNNNLQKKISSNLLSLSGKSQLIWRQGVKHDCSKIMELKKTPAGLTNKLGEIVDIEKEWLFPLIKSSGSRNAIIKNSGLAVIVTQKKLGEDTSNLKLVAPNLWGYLNKHSSLLDSRKSSIYKNSPRFAMFGIGEYSFSPYKVGISGFYKEPMFSIAYGNKAFMYDDTCYFLSFENYREAMAMMLLLNSTVVQDFYRAIAFIDQKRPFSKKVLSQLDLVEALKLVGVEGLNETAKALEINFMATEADIRSLMVLMGANQVTIEQLMG